MAQPVAAGMLGQNARQPPRPQGSRPEGGAATLPPRDRSMPATPARDGGVPAATDVRAPSARPPAQPDADPG
jgi:hypothetical protein